MTTHADSREDLEPGAGFLHAPPPSEPVMADEFAGFQDFWGFNETETFWLPDGKQWIQFKKMTEGDRARYQSKTRPDMTINQRSGEARLPFDPGVERRELIMTSVTDWRMARRNSRTGQLELIPFTNNGSGSNLAQWLNAADPRIVSQLEKAIRKANPWMLGDRGVEELEKEIADLQELLEEAKKREAREAAFPATS